jgi:flagellar biosynthesis/type III secretory pathway M-ring protein FliF/YscJ
MNSRKHWPILLAILLAVVFLLVGQEWFAVRRDEARKAEQAEQARQVERERREAFDNQMAREKARLEALEADNALRRKCLEEAKAKPIINFRVNFQTCIDEAK